MFFGCEQILLLYQARVFSVCQSSINEYSIGFTCDRKRMLIDTRKPRKTCAEVVGRRTFRILTSSQHPATKVCKTATHT